MSLSYVRYLSEADPNKPMPEALKAGAAIFSANCASCHGETGKGNPDVGAPNLTGTRWIYGNDAETIYNSVWDGRRGYMPSWENRLSSVERKILVLYLLDLRGRKATSLKP